MNAPNRPSEMESDDKVLEAIKQGIMSRDIQMQMEAVELLIQYLKIDARTMGVSSNYIPNKFLDADIAEILSEAMATQHCTLLHIIFKCLEELSAHEKFYTQSHVVHVIECLLRTVYFLMKHSEDNSTLIEALKLLGTILEGFGGLQSANVPLSSSCNVKQVVELIVSLIKQENDKPDTALAAGLVFFSLLSHCDSLGEDLDDRLPSIVEQHFSVLSQFLHLNEGVEKKIITLMAMLGLVVMRYCQSRLSKNDLDLEMSIFCSSLPNGQSHEAAEKITNLVYKCIKEHCVARIRDLELVMAHADLFQSVLLCLIILYQDSSVDHQQLTVHLASLDYVILLPSIIEWASKRKLQTVELASRILLAELLISLCEQHLNIAQNWPDGHQSLRNHLLEAMANLPPFLHQWLEVLQAPQTLQSKKYLVIVFFYFFLLSLPSPQDYELDLSILTNHVVQLPKYPVPILKALWFLFTISALTPKPSLPRSFLDKATAVLVNHLESAASIKDLYTHHPALLFWVFSSPRITASIQRQVMSLWLEKENDESSDVHLMQLMLANQDASYCLLELIESGEGTAMDRAKAVLGRAISFEKKQGSENLVMLMWDMMPHVLARYSSRDKHLKDINVSNFMQLACLSLPSKPNMTAIVRSAGFLTSILARHRSAGNDILVTLEVAAIQLALYLLCMSVEMKDMRVLTMYINQENFLRVVSSSIEATEPLRTIPSLRLLLHIAQYQYDHQTKGQLQLKNGQSMEIKGMQLLVLLASQNLVIMQMTLQLLYILLINQLPQPAFQIQLRGTETISSSFVQVLFKQLQYLCVQNHSSIPKNGWKCLGAVLHYTSDRHPDPSLLPILATQPWTHLLFIVALLPTSPKLGSEFLYFLCWWLQHYITKNTSYNRNLRSKSKAAYPNLFSTSVTNISKRLLINEDTNPMEKQLRLLAMVRILLTNADLPEDVEKELRLKLQQSDFKAQDSSITVK